jgi:hypothetical protein
MRACRHAQAGENRLRRLGRVDRREHHGLRGLRRAASRSRTSGRVVALVPGATALTPGTPIWFGTPRLPETVTADVIAAEPWQLHTSALLIAAAPVVREYAPDEGDVADAFAAQGRQCAGVAPWASHVRLALQAPIVLVWALCYTTLLD